MTGIYRVLRDEHLVRRACAIGRTDGRLGQYQEDEVVAFLLGPEINFDPVGSLHDGQLQDALSLVNDITDLRDRERELTEQLAGRWDPKPLLAGMSLLGVVEAAGGVLLMDSLGFDGATRFILGVMLACLLFFLTWLVRSEVDTAASSWALLRRPIPLLYSLLVLALAGTRAAADLTSTGDVAGIEEIAKLAVMVGTTIGPAWMFDLFVREYVQSARLVRVRKQAQRGRRALEQKEQLARRALTTRGESQAWRRGVEPRVRAAYRHEYHTARPTSGAGENA